MAPQGATQAVERLPLDTIQNGKALVTWTRVQRPLHLGGLGVIDMRLMGVALHVRWLWLLKTNLVMATQD
jgi:hypothetical protein